MRRNKHLLLWSSVGTLALLLFAAFQENFLQDWRQIQKQYSDKLPADAPSEFQVQLRQIVVPALEVTDRCVTCHVGMAPGEIEIKGDPLFEAHPNVVHDPAEYGCTVCHGGQGRATAKDDAHGTVLFWPEPMIPAEMSEAGCGSCHTHLEVSNLERLERGKAVFERYDCLACHEVDGRGGTLRPGRTLPEQSPVLTLVGATGYQESWYSHHLSEHRSSAGGAWRHSFGEIPDRDLKDVEAYLSTRVGAPELVRAKSLFHSLGCRGCHPINGVGGDDGPDLSNVGEKDPALLNFTHVPGKRSIPNWLAAHFRAPAKIVPDSQMPYLGLTDRQINGLNLYMLSLRRSNFPEAYWPMDRIRAQYLEEREFATDGGTLYATFCASCHGPQGQGRRYPAMSAFPAIANPEFLSLADDDFILETVKSGRPGRRMPAWGEKEGGLRPGEIERVVEYLRELGGGVEPTLEQRPVTGDPKLGYRLYRVHCGSCHGTDGEGDEGPALANRVFLSTASDAYIAETIRRGRPGTTMPSFETPSVVRPRLSGDQIASITAYIRSWEKQR